MKKIILLMIMVMIIPSVMAIYGGETWIYHFDECDELRVDITGNLEIDEGEYIIHNECMGDNNSFICNCSNDFNFNVSFKINTVNNYTFSFNYDYSREVVETKTTTPSGGSFGGAFSKHLKLGIPFKAVIVSGIDSYFYFNGKRHTMKMINYTNETIKLQIQSEIIEVVLFLNETKTIELEGGLLEIYLQKIYRTTATLILTSFEKEEPQEPLATPFLEEPLEDEPPIESSDDTEDIEETEEEQIEFDQIQDEKNPKTGLIVSVILVVFIISILIILILKNKKKSEGD